MNPITGIFGGIGSAIGWGGADFFAIHNSKQLTPVRTAFLSQTWNMSLAVLLVIITGAGFAGPSWAILAAFGLSALFGLALMCFYSSLVAGPISVVSPLGNSYPLITVLISVGILREQPTHVQLLGILLIICGVIAASVSKDAEGKVERGRGIVLAGMAALLWGVAFSLNGPVISSLGWVRYTFYQSLALSIFLGIICLASRSGRIFDGLTSRVILIMSLFQFAGTLAFNIGRTHSLAAIITPISSLLVLVTIALAMIFLKERPSKLQLAGSVIVVAGLGLLSI